MRIPTEPIGSVPRPESLIDGMREAGAGRLSGQQLESLYDAAVRDTIHETPEEVRERVLEAAEFIPLSHLGTTDDCGFSPFGDDTSTSRETAFAKIRSRVEGTQLAARALSS
jgi:methionine synthase II (cobalamin-independent)